MTKRSRDVIATDAIAAAVSMKWQMGGRHQPLNAGLVQSDFSGDRRQLGRTPSTFYLSCLYSDML